MSGTTQYAPVTPVIAPVSGEPEQRLQQVADAITQNKIQVAQLQSDVKTINDKLATIGQGVTDGSDAAAGEIGEYQSAVLGPGGRVTLPNAANYDLVHLDLTAGDWDVGGAVYFSSSSKNADIEFRAWVNNAALTQPDGTNGGLATNSTTAGGLTTDLNMLPARLNVSATTRMYLGAYVNASTGTTTAYGIVRARRMR